MTKLLTDKWSASSVTNTEYGYICSVSSFEIGWNATQFAVLQYTDLQPYPPVRYPARYRVEFNFNEYEDRDGVLNAIESIPYKGNKVFFQ